MGALAIRLGFELYWIMFFLLYFGDNLLVVVQTPGVECRDLGLSEFEPMRSRFSLKIVLGDRVRTQTYPQHQRPN